MKTDSNEGDRMLDPFNTYYASISVERSPTYKLYDFGKRKMDCRSWKAVLADLKYTSTSNKAFEFVLKPLEDTTRHLKPPYTVNLSLYVKKGIKEMKKIATYQSLLCVQYEPSVLLSIYFHLYFL